MLIMARFVNARWETQAIKYHNVEDLEYLHCRKGRNEFYMLSTGTVCRPHIPKNNFYVDMDNHAMN